MRPCKYCGKDLKSKRGDTCSTCANKLPALRALRRLIIQIKKDVEREGTE